MRPTAVLLVLALLLAGCAQDEPTGPTFETGEEEEPRVSAPGSGGRGDNLTRLWEHKIVWEPDAAPPATTMTIPANVSMLVFSLSSLNTLPCGANLGESNDPLGPSADFLSPSGKATRIGISANECRAAGAFVTSIHGTSTLDAEAGVWQVEFRGRGAGLEQTLTVKGNVTA